VKKILLGIFLLFCFQIEAQITFERRDSIPGFGGIASPIPNSIVETSDHGFLIAGTVAMGLINVFYWEKINSAGYHEWGHTTYISGEDAYINSAALTSDNGFILCGKSVQDKIGILKTDFYGSTEWYKIINGQQMIDSHGSSARQTKDGGYIIAGAALINPTPNFYTIDGGLIKLDSLGNYAWSKSYGIESSISVDRFYDIGLTEDSGFVAVGSANLGEYIFIVRTNSIGDTLWTKQYKKGTTIMEGKSITSAYDDGFVIACSNTNYESVLLKINSLGDTLWTKDLDGITVNHVEETNDSGLILSVYEGLLIKTNLSGDIQWVRDLPVYCNYAIQTQDNGYAIAGSYFSVVKTDSAGNTSCTSNPASVNISMNGLDQKFETISVQIDTLPNPGTTFSSILDLEEVISCSSLSINNPIFSETTILITPNPTQHYLTISSQTELTLVEIFNSIGKVVKRISSNGQNKIEVDIDELNPGLYIIKLTSKQAVVTEKIIKN